MLRRKLEWTYQNINESIEEMQRLQVVSAYGTYETDSSSNIKRSLLPIRESVERCHTDVLRYVSQGNEKEVKRQLAFLNESELGLTEIARQAYYEERERYIHPRSIVTSLSSKDATARVLREQFERVATNVKIIDHTIKDPKHPELIQFFVKEADDDQGQWITEPNVKGRYTHAWMIYAEERGWIPKGRPPDP